jgi:O-glycosyl hydrolase
VEGAATLTFNGAVTNQVIDGFGVNANYRNWSGTELQPVLDAYIDEAGMTLFRVVYELSDWEATNDNADAGVMNWSYYNPVYSSTEFTRLWDVMAYFNGRGITNGAYMCFMGWGPSWMMAADQRTLGATKEEEWAEMIASALIHARNTRGLKFSLVAPNNEPDIFNEGIRMDATQYTNALHRLALKLDTNGLGDLRFVGPDRAGGGTGYMPEMLADPVIMAKLKHFGVHSYTGGGGQSTGVYGLITNSAYPDRTFWMTEFNKWCDGCDTGQVGNYGWDYTRATAEYLLWDMLNGASGGMVWEGYDSIYAHHGYSWSYWGLFGVDDINAPVKTYTPRKHFYTLSQISKWVRPGSRRIGITGSASTFSPLVAFKHDGLGQVTIVGLNTSTSAATLDATLTNLPAVSSMSLYYTSATTNLALAGTAAVSNGAFSIQVPADCVFTLTGFTAGRLTNGVSRTGTNSGTGLLEDRYQFTVTNPVGRAQFEVIAPTGDVTLRLRKGLPPESPADFDYLSANPGTNSEVIVLRADSAPKPIVPGDWFLSVVNVSGTNVSYAVRATQWAATGLPLIIGPPTVQPGSVCLSWNSLTGAVYVVQGSASLGGSSWVNESGTIRATNPATSFCAPLSPSMRSFRVVEGVALDTGGIGF